VKKILVAAALVGLSLGACGPKTMFRLTSEDHDNDRAALTKALAARQLPEQPAPVNAARQPRAFVVESGKQKKIIAYDLDAGRVAWQQPADITSRVWVGGDFIVDVEGKHLVARDQRTGNQRWRLPLGGEFIGASADRDHAYLAWKEDGSKPLWYIAAYDGASGKELWHHDAEGALGAPVAQGGVVYSPFLSQWLAILDGNTGVQLARIRGIDDQISMVRTTSQKAYFGSKRGVYMLDARAASGKRADATYGEVKIPQQLDRTSYGVDVYDPVQLGYTAADRARVLFTGISTDTGPMKLAGDTYAVHYFRYIFGFTLDGQLAWAYSHPRVELVATEHTGNVIVGVSSNGELVAIDPNTGAVRARRNLGTGGPIIGATFDADGWNPQGEGEKVETAEALVHIIRDRDARFDRVKELAVASLAKLPGGQVTKEMLGVLADKRASVKLKDTVVDALVQRKDPDSLPVLTEQLAVHADFIAKTDPDSLGAVARTIGGLAGAKLEAKAVDEALAALQSHLEDPATAASDIALLIKAMTAIGGGKERLVLASHLLLYHADDELGVDVAWQKAIVDALSAKSGPADRTLLQQVAADPRTQPGLTAAIHTALAND
jgi:outer membrane protein assembly factor BamB